MSTLEEHLYLNVKLLSIRRVADIFKRIRFVGKQLGYFYHREKKKITDNNKLVHPFLGGGRSGCYLCESSGIHDLQCACGYMQQTRSSDIR